MKRSPRLYQSVRLRCLCLREPRTYSIVVMTTLSNSRVTCHCCNPARFHLVQLATSVKKLDLPTVRASIRKQQYRAHEICPTLQDLQEVRPCCYRHHHRDYSLNLQPRHRNQVPHFKVDIYVLSPRAFRLIHLLSEQLAHLPPGRRASTRESAFYVPV